MIRVAVIDDHYVVRLGLKTIIELNADLEFAGEASGGASAVKFVMDVKPDVLLLDIKMPDRDGIAVLEDILLACPGQKVIMLTTSDAENDVYRSIKLGAKGYLLKDRDSNEITTAIRSVAEGGKFIPEAMRELYQARQMMSALTQRETSVLELVAEGLKNEEIAERLEISYDGVKQHVRHLLAKFEARDRTMLVSEARRRGFV